LTFLLQTQSRPKPGDLIEISRIGYAHWAIYVGNGYVVHLTSLSKGGLSLFFSLLLLLQLYMSSFRCFIFFLNSVMYQMESEVASAPGQALHHCFPLYSFISFSLNLEDRNAYQKMELDLGENTCSRVWQVLFCSYILSKYSIRYCSSFRELPLILIYISLVKWLFLWSVQNRLTEPLHHLSPQGQSVL
jgi:hypothetical protein